MVKNSATPALISGACGEVAPLPHPSSHSLLDLKNDKINAGSRLLTVENSPHLSQVERDSINNKKIQCRQNKKKVMHLNFNKNNIARNKLIKDLRDDKLNKLEEPSFYFDAPQVIKKKRLRSRKNKNLIPDNISEDEYFNEHDFIEVEENYHVCINDWMPYERNRKPKILSYPLTIFYVRLSFTKHCCPHDGFYISQNDWYDYLECAADDCDCGDYCDNGCFNEDPIDNDDRFYDIAENEEREFPIADWVYHHDDENKESGWHYETQSSVVSRYYTQSRLEKYCLISNAIDGFIGKVASEWIDWLMSFVDLTHCLVTAEPSSAKRLALQFFLEKCGVKGYESRAISWAVNKLATTKHERTLPVLSQGRYATQALSDDLDTMGDVLEYVFDSSFADALKTVFLTAASMKWFGRPVRGEIFLWLGAPMKGAYYDLIRLHIKALAKVVKAYEAYMYENIPLMDVLFAKDSWVHATTKAANLLFQKDHLYNGLPAEGKYNKHTWLKECNEVLIYLKDRLKKTSQLKAKYTEIAKMVTALEQAKSYVMQLMGGGYRHAPFGVIIGELPGIGKSNLIDYIAYTWCQVKGHRFSSDLIWHRNQADDYMSGLSTQPIYHYSELGTQCEKLLQSKGNPALQEFTSVMDSVSYLANMANVEDKGKIHCTPELVLADTNNMDLGVKHVQINIAAYLRRFFFTLWEILDQFKKEGSCEVDGFKVAQALAAGEIKHCLDIYRIYAWREVAVSVKTPRRVDIGDPNGMNIYEFNKVLIAEMEKHIASQVLVEDMRKGNKMFRLDDDDKEQDFDDDASVHSDNVGKQTLTSVVDRVSGFMNKIGNKIKDNVLPVVKDTTKEWQDAAYDSLMKFNIDSDVESEIDFDIKDVDEVYSVIEQELLPKRLPTDHFSTQSGSSDVDEKIIEGDIPEPAVIVTIAGHEYVVLNPGPSMNLSNGVVASYVVSKFGCSHIYNNDGLRALIDRKSYLDKEDSEVLNSEHFVSNQVRMVFKSRGNKKNKVMAKFSDIGSSMKELGQCAFYGITYSYTSIFGNVKEDDNATWLVKKLVYVFLLLTSFNISVWASVAWLGFSYLLNFYVDKDKVYRNFMSAFTTLCTKGWFDQKMLKYVAPTIGIGLTLYLIADKIRDMASAPKQSYYEVNDTVKKRETFLKECETLLPKAPHSGLNYLSECEKVLEHNSLPSFVTEACGVDVPTINQFEEKVNAGNSYERINLSGNKEIWNDRKVSPPACKDGVDALVARVNKNVRYVEIVNGTRKRQAYGLGLKEDWLLLCKHYLLGKTNKITLYMHNVGGGRISGSPRVLNLELDDFVDVGVDLCLVRLGENLFSDIVNHISSEGVEETCYSRIQNYKVNYWTASGAIVDDHESGTSYTLDTHAVYSGDFKDGDCGWPLICEKANGSVISAIHVAGSPAEKVGIGEFLNLAKLKQAMSTKSYLCQAVSVPYEEHILADCFISMDDFETPNVKSSFRHIHLPNIEYYGKRKGKKVLAKSKSRLKKSLFADNDLFYAMFTDVFDHPSKEFMRPLMEARHVNGEYLSPYNNNLNKLNVPRKNLNRKIMNKVVFDLSEKILKGLADKGVPSLSPLDMNTAINGVSHDDFLRRVNCSTAAGYGYDGKKKSDLLPLLDETTRGLLEEVQETLREVMLLLSENVEVKFVFKAALKDEPREASKVYAGKTRVFFMSPLVGLIICRMFLQPFFSMMQEFNELFCTTIGINMHMHAEDLFNRLFSFSQNWMEGDYAGYDTSISPDVKWIAFSVIVRVLENYGYNAFAVQITRALLMSMITMYVSMLEDLFSVPGATPSGMYATAELNSLVGLILLMLFWEYNKPLEDNDFDFFDYVMPATYGDDVLAAVKEAVANWFNNITYAEFVNKVLNMEYTSAAKDGTLSAFVDPNRASFLKRTWVNHVDLKRLVAILDYNSIYKMLYWTIPSEYISKKTQMLMTVDSALREGFFHLNREKYAKFRDGLLSLMKPHFLFTAKDISTYLHSYDKLVGFYSLTTFNEDNRDLLMWKVDQRNSVEDFDFNRYSTQGFSTQKPLIPRYNDNKKLLLVNNLGFKEDSRQEGTPELKYVVIKEASPTCIMNRKYEGDKQQWFSVVENLRNLLNNLEVELKEALVELDKQANIFPDMNYQDARKTVEFQSSPEARVFVEQYYKVKERVNALESSIASARSLLSRHSTNNRFTTQSAVGVEATGTIDPATVEVDENITHVGGEEVKDFTFGTSTSAMKETSLEMKDWFHRYIEIANFTAAIGLNQYIFLNPWQDYLAEPSVRAKIRNYAFMRADLTVKLVISASPFHYGTFLVALIPKAVLNEIYMFYKGANMSNYGFQFAKWISSIPGSALMKVGDNKPVELHLPYINTQPVIRLWNNSAGVTGTIIEGVIDMCELVIVSVNAPETCNSSAPTSLSIQVEARLDNVQLGGPTATQMSIATESKVYSTQSKVDEFNSGPVSSMASSMARWLGYLTDIPTIGPYAYASKMVVSGAGKIASLFGYSSPVMSPAIHTPMIVRNEPLMNAVNTSTVSTGKKMTVDPRQELSLDPRLFGRTEDELSMAYIASIPSLIYKFTWGNADVPLNSVLFSSIVNPNVIARGPTDSVPKTFLQPSNLNYAATPFRYWRGDMIFKFVINKCMLHKGEIMFIFDPVVAQYTLITSNIKLNKQGAIIVDIQETDEFEICVKFNNAKYWADTLVEPFNSRGIDEIATYATSYQDSCSGFIFATPFTRLQSPDGAGVDVNVFVYSKNMEFNFYDNTRLPSRRCATQSKMVDTEAMTCMDINEENTDGNHKLLYNFGEQPVSFRQYLKRYGYTVNRAVVNPIVGTAASCNLLYPDVSPPWGVNAAVSYVSLISYLRYAYVGMRGSVRKRIRWIGNSSNMPGNHVKVIYGFNDGAVPALGGTTSSQFADCTERGVASFVPTTNGGIEVELPCYTSNLYLPSGVANSVSWVALADPNFDPTFPKTYYTGVDVPIAVTGSYYMVEETAFGDDFTLGGYLAPPPYTKSTV